MDTIKDIVRQLGLQPHPEGGFYRETYRSPDEVQPIYLGHKGKRNCSTCIYFLLTSDSFSAFHRIKQDEIWHFYKGSPVGIHMISKDGLYSMIRLGNNFDKGEIPQFVVPNGTWFASEVIDENGFALTGCTVSPGFDFADFEMGNRQKLIDAYPHAAEIIRRLTRDWSSDKVQGTMNNEQ